MIPVCFTPKKNVKIHQDKIIKNFESAVINRRKIYAISKDVKVTDARIQEIIEFGVKHAPSVFNSQSSRAVLLLGKHHDKFWSITTEILRKIVPADKFAPAEAKMKGFASEQYYSLKIKYQSKNSKNNSHHMLISSLFGQNMHQECYNSLFGLLWKQKDLEHHFNIIPFSE